MDRQYSRQKNFGSVPETFQSRDRGRDAVRTPLASLAEPQGEALFVDRSSDRP